MLEIQAEPFLGAVTEMRSLILMIDNIQDKSAQIGPDDRSGILADHVERLIQELQKLGARSAISSASRLQLRLSSPIDSITYLNVQAILADIESRFADHLSDIRLFVLNPGESMLFGSVDELLTVEDQPIEGFALAFPRSAFEIEESAKCIALGRYTASAFHAIRALECGIRAIARYLSIPDPTKPAEKNWAIILKAIKSAIDDKWPSSSRLPDSEGAKLEALYTSLDAAKNPWRNATMHVETVYAPHEALHILRCVCMFMLNLSQLCDEQGRAPSEAPAMAAVEDAETEDKGEAA